MIPAPDVFDKAGKFRKFPVSDRILGRLCQCFQESGLRFQGQQRPGFPSLNSTVPFFILRFFCFCLFSDFHRTDLQTRQFYCLLDFRRPSFADPAEQKINAAGTMDPQETHTSAVSFLQRSRQLNHFSVILSLGIFHRSLHLTGIGLRSKCADLAKL